MHPGLRACHSIRHVFIPRSFGHNWTLHLECLEYSKHCRDKWHSGEDYYTAWQWRVSRRLNVFGSLSYGIFYSFLNCVHTLEKLCANFFSFRILDCNFLQHCILDSLHGTERFEKLTSHSFSQELPIFYGDEVFIFIQKKSWTLTWSRRSQSAPLYSRHWRSLYFGFYLRVSSLYVCVELSSLPRTLRTLPLSSSLTFRA
jgi:hypothetical protein